MLRWATEWSVAALLSCQLVACASDDVPPPSSQETWTNAAGTVTVRVEHRPFSLSIRDAQGRELLTSASSGRGHVDAPLGITHNADRGLPTIGYGWDSYLGDDEPWTTGAHVADVSRADGSLVLTIALDGHDPATLRFDSQGTGVRMRFDVPAGARDINRVSFAFRMQDDDAFLGFGERFARANQRGQRLYTWVEEGGFGRGENVPPAIDVPFPNGPTMTNIPVPWFMSPRGFGVLMNTSYKTNYHLGDEAPDAWRIESTTPTWDATLFAERDPTALLERLTEITGRPPAVPDWIFAPRRRGFEDEGEKLRAAHIPTTAMDTAIHYFPSGPPGDAAAMRAHTTALHARGFKAIAYFTSHVATTWQPVFDDLKARGLLVKGPDGQPFVVGIPPVSAALIDFTNAEAVRWYEGWIDRALDDGFDGWMFDFGEYLPRSAVLANGMRGTEAHNLFPVWAQTVMRNHLERRRPGDYLFFVRSGYAGTGGVVPMVWAGDQNSDFSDSDGLPAALTGALNLGMSGMPFWGSDISGYHHLFNPPPDEEVYLRWTELSAFSADMHDENVGEGRGERWQIWKSPTSIDVYRRYASYKTRMIPYVRSAAEEARARGTPVMRHLFLAYPGDARVWSITDEYMFGPSLLVAPVVRRDARARTVYLPEDMIDFWTGAHRSKGEHVVDAPLDSVPVFARPGAIVPMYAEDVETLFPSSDPQTVSLASREHVREVRIFRGPESVLALSDGTRVTQRPTDASTPPKRGDAPLPPATTVAELSTCSACAWSEPGRTRIAVETRASEEHLTGPGFEITLARSPGTAISRFFLDIRR